MGFTDTHVHLHFPEYEADRADVLERAHAAGVDLFINVGTDIPSSRQSLALSAQHENVFATVGIHPHDAAAADDQCWNEFAEMLKDPKAVAIGEVGLDFYRNLSPRDKQKEVLKGFLRLHQKTGKPLVLHCRDAYEDLIMVLKEELKPPFHGVMHCFSSDRAMMTRLVDLGFYISFAGPLTYKKNDSLREACQACPKDRLLLETDAPFLPPQTMRGKRNEPGYMIETAQVAADLHKINLEQLAEQSTKNARKVFGLC